jgi:hypothetical protein
MRRGFSPAYTEQEDINSQLNAVKLKLEERRKKIEDEKRKMEVRHRRIRDILVRIRIRGSVPLLTDSDPTPDPASFVTNPQDGN